MSDDDNERAHEDRESGGGDGGGRSITVPGTGWFGKLGAFYHSVKLEMLRTSWPTRTEVWSTTLVVLIAVTFFGFYLWGLDQLISMGFSYLQDALK